LVVIPEKRDLEGMTSSAALRGGRLARAKRISAILLVVGLMMEFWEAAKSDNEVADTKERTALVESNNLVLSASESIAVCIVALNEIFSHFILQPTNPILMNRFLFGDNFQWLPDATMFPSPRGRKRRGAGGDSGVEPETGTEGNGDNGVESPAGTIGATCERKERRRTMKTQEWNPASLRLTATRMEDGGWQARSVLECGGKRSATPLWNGTAYPFAHVLRGKSAVAAPLCRRSPKWRRVLRVPQQVAPVSACEYLN